MQQDHKLIQLLGAIDRLMQHREGELPTLGYLHDCSGSRRALADVLELREWFRALPVTERLVQLEKLKPTLTLVATNVDHSPRK
jgi:hypothetical protein